MAKIKTAIIGSGNIGTDLMMKISEMSDVLEVGCVIGIDEKSEGLAKARERGFPTSHTGIEGAQALDVWKDVKIVFDATSAYVHEKHSDICTAEGKQMVDLTPAAIGPFCIPPVNLKQHAERLEMNVNMVTCGGQATIPMVAAVSRVQEVSYGEIVATVSSKSVGPGTRVNIDEFTRTTAAGVEQVGGAKEGKAIIVINPAEPPLMMRDTVHCLTADAPDREAISESIHSMIKDVQRYVPGYRLVNGPVFEGNRITVYLEVEGLGDFLPTYAGNLDIMTAAGLRTAELFAEESASGRLQLPQRA